MPNVISSVKALLQHNDRILVMREELHKGDIWDLPGGKIKYDESPKEALHREVKEELDIDIEIIRSVGVWFFYSQNSKHQVICHTFLCKPIGNFTINTSKNPADEHFTELRWLTAQEIIDSKDVTLGESFRELLQDFVSENK